MTGRIGLIANDVQHVSLEFSRYPSDTPPAMLRFTFAILLFSVPGSTSQAENWARFRGDNGLGISHQTGIPTTWGPDDYAWVVELDDLGHSQPVIWDNALFLTTANAEGTKRYLHRLNADTGEEIWRRSQSFETGHKHLKNSWASSTPTTDGERVYVIFADEKSHVVTAWTFDGEELWSRNLGGFESQHGQGVSPIVEQGLLIVPNDQRGPSAIMALNSQTGETVWSVERPSGAASYSTPILLPGSGGNTQLICLSEASGLVSLDLKTGRLNWQTAPMPMRTVAGPAAGKDVVVATCGQGGNGKYLIAVNATETTASPSRTLFERTKQLPYVPTCVVLDNLLFLWSDSGILSCLDVYTGKEYWTQKRVTGSFSSSPVCIEGRLFSVSEDGDVVIIRASDHFELLGRVSLGDRSHTTPVVANGHLYLRTFSKLMALKAGK
jgi:outer membrane protein assembly factor BamB